jgi:hypothetical protein
MHSIELTVLMMMMPEINDTHIAIYIVLLRQHKTGETVLIPAFDTPDPDTRNPMN